MLDIKKLTTKQLVELALISALMIGGKEALRMIPNVHPVALLLILCVIVYGYRSLYTVAVFLLAEIVIYGLGLWTIMYLYIWPLLVFVTLPFRKSRNWVVFGVIAGLHGLLFGVLCSIPYIFISGFKAAFAYWIAGIPYDIIHCLSNFVIVIVCLPYLFKVFQRRYPEELS